MTEQKKMTVEDVFSVVMHAHLIKKWPGEYRIYSKDNIVFIYCDQIGLPVYYVYTVDGKQYPFSDFESKMLSAIIEERYVRLCRAGLKDMVNDNKTK